MTLNSTVWDYVFLLYLLTDPQHRFIWQGCNSWITTQFCDMAHRDNSTILTELKLHVFYGFTDLCHCLTDILVLFLFHCSVCSVVHPLHKSKIASLNDIICTILRMRGCMGVGLRYIWAAICQLWELFHCMFLEGKYVQSQLWMEIVLSKLLQCSTNVYWMSFMFVSVRCTSS